MCGPLPAPPPPPRGCSAPPLDVLPGKAWLAELTQEPGPLWELLDASAVREFLRVLRTSLIGHLSGILVGLLYTLGPLRIIMETCAESVSSDMNDPRPSTYFNFSGHSGTGPESLQNAEDRTAEDRTAKIVRLKIVQQKIVQQRIVRLKIVQLKIVQQKIVQQ
ncbi:Rhomboid-related protein 4 [Larimichthys crocea]|uniref:Rhomboid-related protein 4 n=1 Tax=Larimichthys crocea TaxID=215358 RepID=A0A6G0ITR1_LARCR|nr:Rhomboid-related protein 4 [Larimichthys crocea]